MVETVKAWSLDVASFFGLEAGETAQEIQIYVDRMSDRQSPVVLGRRRRSQIGFLVSVQPL